LTEKLLHILKWHWRTRKPEWTRRRQRSFRSIGNGLGWQRRKWNNTDPAYRRIFLLYSQRTSGRKI